MPRQRLGALEEQTILGPQISPSDAFVRPGVVAPNLTPDTDLAGSFIAAADRIGRILAPRRELKKQEAERRLKVKAADPDLVKELDEALNALGQDATTQQQQDRIEQILAAHDVISPALQVGLQETLGGKAAVSSLEGLESEEALLPFIDPETSLQISGNR